MNDQEQTTRTIDLTPNWRAAAQIIAAALENGTGSGKAMAREELFRMADMLDQVAKQQAEGESHPDLYEVIAHADGAAFGVTFTSAKDADAYAKAMLAEGRTVDPYYAYCPESTLDAALASADDFFNHGRGRK